MALLHYFRGWLSLLLVFFPILILLEMLHAPVGVIFAVACLSIIPLAGLMGKATEDLAERAGTGVGGLLNATFGNAAELIIAISAIRRGLVPVVKASLIGSILGNLIFVMGFALLAGGLRHRRQFFNRTAAGSGVTMMSVAVMGMLVPAVYHQLAGRNLSEAQLPNIETMSLIISGVLILNYACGLVFSLKTHRDLYNGGEGQADAADYVTAGVGENTDEPGRGHRPLWAAVTMLLLATAAVAVASELLVATLEPVMHKLKMSELFTGAVIIAIIGNAAEHSTAIIVALRNKMDLAMQICIGSSMQVALFVTPALVFISLALGKPMTLEFTAVEILSVFGAVFVVTTIANDGESNWFEGVQLITLYAVMAVAFYFL